MSELTAKDPKFKFKSLSGKLVFSETPRKITQGATYEVLPCAVRTASDDLYLSDLINQCRN